MGVLPSIREPHAPRTSVIACGRRAAKNADRKVSTADELATAVHEPGLLATAGRHARLLWAGVASPASFPEQRDCDRWLMALDRSACSQRFEGVIH